jgi:hypothetical protein
LLPAKRSLFGYGSRCCSFRGDGLHGQADAPLVVGLNYFDLDDLTFLQIIADRIDALIGDLRNMQQTILARQQADDGAEIQQT